MGRLNPCTATKLDRVSPPRGMSASAAERANDGTGQGLPCHVSHMSPRNKILIVIGTISLSVLLAEAGRSLGWPVWARALVNGLCIGVGVLLFNRGRRPRPWMRNPDVRRLLSGFARGDLALSHDTFDRDPARRTASHLRELLMRHGALPQQDRTLLLFSAWLEATLARYSPSARALLHRFATWHHLRRMRRASGEGTLKPTASNAARQSITTAGQLLTTLEDDGIEFSSMTQAHLDAWLATGPSTRYSARTFVVWAVQAGHLPALTFPH